MTCQSTISHEVYLRLAKKLGEKFSKDTSTKIGCLFVNATDKNIIARGYNGMPRGYPDANIDLLQRPLKYTFFEHAERNAIYNEMRSYMQNTIAILTKAPTADCLRGLISCGVEQVWYKQSKDDSADTQAMLDMLATYATLEDNGVFKLVPFNITLNGFEISTKTQEIYGCEEFKTSDKTLVCKNYEFLEDVIRGVGKDPNVVGCSVINRLDKREITSGYSGMPRGLDDSQNLRYVTPELRAKWVEGAGRNAIYNLARKLGIFKNTIAYVSATSCIDCARAILAVGAQSIVCLAPTADMKSRWEASFKATENLCAESGIDFKVIEI